MFIHLQEVFPLGMVRGDTTAPGCHIPCGRTYRGLRLGWEQVSSLGTGVLPGDWHPRPSSPGHSRFSSPSYSRFSSPVPCPCFPQPRRGSSLCLLGSRIFPACSCSQLPGGEGTQRLSWDRGRGLQPAALLGLIPTGYSFVPQFPQLGALGEGPTAPPPLRGPDGASTGCWAGLSPAGSGEAPAEATPAAAALRPGGE